MKNYEDPETLLDILIKIKFVSYQEEAIVRALTKENQEKFADELQLLTTIAYNLPESNARTDMPNIMAADNCVEAMFDLYRPFMDALYEVFKRQNYNEVKQRISPK